MKIISLIVRRPDLDRAAFARHYDERHAPLALQVLPAPFRAYRRNHVVEPDDAPCDCLSEFVFPDAEATKQIFEYLASPDSAVIHEDEERFMDRPRNAFYVVEEEVVRARPADSGDGAVGVWVLSESAPVDREAAVACAHNHVKAPSRPDAPGWSVLTELWYPDAATWERDRPGLAAEGAADRVVRIRESVSVRDPAPSRPEGRA